jgi:hypothetical protein
VEHGGECVAPAEKRAQEQRDQLRGMLGKLGHSDRGVDELNGTALERAIDVAAKCERARALADMLGKPARVHRLEKLAENETAVELLVLSLEEEVGTFWKPHVMGCCAVAVVVVVATVLLVNRCFGRLERTVERQADHTKAAMARSEAREERLIGAVEGLGRQQRERDGVLLGAVQAMMFAMQRGPQHDGCPAPVAAVGRGRAGEIGAGAHGQRHAIAGYGGR